MMIDIKDTEIHKCLLSYTGIYTVYNLVKYDLVSIN
jgi:hypothetical protein